MPTNSIKILHFIYDYVENPWFGGGGSVRTLKIYKELVQKGILNFQVDVVIGNYPGANHKLISKRIRICPVGIPSRVPLVSVISYTLFSYIIFFTRRKYYDIVINDFCPYMPLILWGINVIYSIQNYFGIKTLKRYLLFGVIPFIAEKMAIKFGRKFIAVSHYLQQVISQLNQKAHVLLIPNGIDDYYLKIKRRERDYILYIGRIDIYQKGLDILLKAFSLYTKKYPWITLIIAGKGKDFNKLRKLVNEFCINSERIKILGYVNEATKIDLLKGCLFAVFPSRFESFPITALEAEAIGAPVIATHIPGLKEIVVNGQTGILVSPNDYRILFMQMCYLTDNTKERERLSLNAKNFAKNYTWKKVAETFKCSLLGCIKGEI